MTGGLVLVPPYFRVVLKLEFPLPSRNLVGPQHVLALDNTGPPALFLPKTFEGGNPLGRVARHGFYPSCQDSRGRVRPCRESISGI